MATAKHLIGYEQETFRSVCAAHYMRVFHTRDRDPYNALLDLQLPISSNIDDEATHEVNPQHSLCLRSTYSLWLQLYLWGFAEAVRVGVSFVMWCVRKC